MQKRTMIIGGIGAGVVLVLVGAGVTFAATELFDDDDRVSAVQDTDAGQNTPTDTSTGSSPSSTPSSSPTNSYTDDDGNRLTDDERSKVEAAALAATGTGRVTDIDREDDEDDHLYDVEVTFEDGTDWDLEISADFQVVEIDRD